jgi:cyclohexanecarboxylate-CoA ligase
MRATIPLDPRYRRPGAWEGRTISSFLDDAVRLFPDRLAVVDGGVSLTYSELNRSAAAVAASMKQAGVQQGHPVLVQLPNWWETIVVYHAIARLGAVINPVIPIYRQNELRFILDQAQPSAVVTPHRFRNFGHLEMAQELVDETLTPVMAVRAEGPLPGHPLVIEPLGAPEGTPEPAGGGRPDDIAMLLYSSGTTGKPKGVLHSHETLVYECRSIQRLFNLSADDHIFMASPLTHVTGFLYGFILPVMLGCTSVLLDVWEPETALDLIETYRCRFTVSATPFLQGLTESYKRRGIRSSFRYFACGGADVPPDLVRQAVDVLGCHVSRIYGSSEFPTVSSGGPTDPVACNAATDGRPIGPVEVRLDEAVEGIGELLARGPECFHGYLDAALNDGAFTEDGFFHTGDLASIDDAGYITIQGRKKDIIIRKGENISAREVEDLLFAHELVADVAVVAVPDPETGERACAVVVARPGAELTLQSLTGYLERRGVAKQKFPEQLVMVEALPRTASGKVQKFLLRAEILAERAR